MENGNKNLLDFKPTRESDIDWAKQILTRAEEIRSELSRCESGYEIAIVFGVIVTSFMDTLSEEKRNALAKDIDRLAAVFGAARQIERGELTLEEAKARLAGGAR